MQSKRIKDQKEFNLMHRERYAQEAVICLSFCYLILTITSIGGYIHTRKIIKSLYWWLHKMTIWAFNNSNCRHMLASVNQRNKIQEHFVLISEKKKNSHLTKNYKCWKLNKIPTYSVADGEQQVCTWNNLEFQPIQEFEFYSTLYYHLTGHLIHAIFHWVCM